MKFGKMKLNKLWWDNDYEGGSMGWFADIKLDIDGETHDILMTIDEWENWVIEEIKLGGKYVRPSGENILLLVQHIMNNGIIRNQLKQVEV